MIYERILYMCPKCNQGHFFNKAEEYSTICPDCNIEMRDMGSDFVDSEEEKERSERFQKRLQQSLNDPTPLVTCPYCNSVNTSKISTTAKVVNTALFGIFGTKRHKQWHCNDCNSDF